MAMQSSVTGSGPTETAPKEMLLAVGVILILMVLFIPLPTVLIDLGLAFSISLSVVILMVALWIEKPLEFSVFPTVLLIATMLRLALNVATTRAILANGSQGVDAAGNVIAGFSEFVMGGDFVIGTVVFVILVVVNFVVITKGATRIAEVGARFTLDAIPGKQMAIDADLSAGTIDEQEARRRRQELEEESSFFGSMDGASKFVRGDAIAGIIITAVNVFGGIIIGVTRYNMELSQAADVFTKLSIGDGLVTQIPALIVSLSAGLLVAKGGTRGSAEKAVFSQIGNYPRAIFLSGLVIILLGIAPGLPILPFAMLGGGMLALSRAIPRQIAAREAAKKEMNEVKEREAIEASRDTLKESLKVPELELCLGKQISASLLKQRDELHTRVGRLRRKFVEQFGFVVPEIKVSDDVALNPKRYELKIHGTVVASEELRVGEVLVILGDGPKPDLPGEDAVEPAFGMKAMWFPQAYAAELKRDGFTAVDSLSALLTHAREVVRNHLSQLLSYKDMRSLLDRLDPEYKRLLDEICPSQISNSGLQAVLKLLLAERVSIRNLNLILEAIAEVAPHVRRAEQLVEHVRMRIASQICGDLADGGVLKVLRLGPRWDLAFHEALKRDQNGEVVEFDIAPSQIEEFGKDLTKLVKGKMDAGHSFVLVTTPDMRTFVRMVTERLFPTLSVLSHTEIARGIQVETLGSAS